MAEPAPVVQCDRCGVVAPLRMTASDGSSIEGPRREAELRTEGWHLADQLDTCPRCTRQAAVLEAIATVPCPTCDAGPHDDCRTASGRPTRDHRARVDLAQADA